MKDTLHQEYRDRMVDEAADWFARLQDPEVTAEERAQFSAWLSASSEHVHEFLALTALHTDISELSVPQTADDLVRLAGVSQQSNVVGFKVPASGLSRLLTRRDDNVEGHNADNTGGVAFRKYLALAASVAVVTIAAWWWLRTDANTAHYTTSIGEQKSFTLPDSSVVTLNAVSTLQVRYTEHYRDLQLLSGEALFSVARNPRRPFRVVTEDSVVQAVGTRFNVRHRDENTTVTVVEGKVAVSSMPASGLSMPQSSSLTIKNVSAVADALILASGEQVTLRRSAPARPVRADPAAATAWRERRLIFESRPLSEAVAEFNLYNTSPIGIRDPALNGIQISGSFYANDPQSFLMFLEEAHLARTKTEGGETVLLPLK